MSSFPTPTGSPEPGAGGRATDRLSIRAIARMAGLSHTAMQRRYERGDLPSPAGVRTGGWPFWQEAEVRAWLEQLPEQQCPVCGIKTKRLRWHVDQRHPDAAGGCLDGETTRRPDRPAAQVAGEMQTPGPAGDRAVDRPGTVGIGLDWLTTSQVASDLQVSVQLVRTLVTAGDLPARRAPDGSYQVERGMYERWLTRQYQLAREFVTAQPFPARNRPHR